MKLYKTMHHHGGLEEALETQLIIDPYLAEYLINTGIYKEYSYDNRIEAKRYIFTPIYPMKLKEKWEIPTWLLEFNKGDPRK